MTTANSSRRSTETNLLKINFRLARLVATMTFCCHLQSLSVRIPPISSKKVVAPILQHQLQIFTPDFKHYTHFLRALLEKFLKFTILAIDSPVLNPQSGFHDHIAHHPCQQEPQRCPPIQQILAAMRANVADSGFMELMQPRSITVHRPLSADGN